jgi:DNA repair protein RadC
MNESKSIKNWSEDERPREKMLQKGASALTDAELLAKRSALDLARDVLELAHKNLREVGRLNVLELKKINGIGEARAITICAAMELGRRRQVSEGLERATIRGSRQAGEFILPLLQDLHHEVLCVVYLNQASKYIKHEIASSGGTTSTVVDIKMILKNCLLNNANQIIIAHNHPSGSLKPSDADKQLTIKLRNAAGLMDIKLLDHIIVGSAGFLSLSDDGYI